MHCVLLNIVPGLWSIWTGKKLEVNKRADIRKANKPLRRSSLPAYILLGADIADIGTAMQQARTSIPLQIGHAPRNI